MAASLNKLRLVATLLCLSGAAFAGEVLPDPTKPAVEIPYPAEAGIDNTANVVPIAKREGLQSVFISPHHRAAIINGDTVTLGGKVGDATLVEIREDSVVLQSVQGKRVMELFPGVHLNKTEVAVQENALSFQKNKKELKPKVGSKRQNLSQPVNSGQEKENRGSL